MINLLTLGSGKPGDAASPSKRKYQESPNQGLTLTNRNRQKRGFWEKEDRGGEAEQKPGGSQANFCF